MDDYLWTQLVRPRTISWIVSDLDGTLSDHQHRMHLIKDGPGGHKDWDAFTAASSGDSPIYHNIAILQAMQAKFGTEVIVLTGRGSSAEEETHSWLRRHGVPYSHLFMRDHKDHRPDTEAKLELFQHYVYPITGTNIMFFLEDRSRMVNLWRSMGYPCLQVAPGGF